VQLVPTACSLAELYQEEGGQPGTALGYSLGTTGDPENFQLPAFAMRTEIDRVAHGQILRNRVIAAQLNVVIPRAPMLYQTSFNVITHPTEGNNRSLYVRSGLFETNYTFEEDDAENDQDWRTKIAAYLKARRSDANNDLLLLPHQPRVYLYVSLAVAGRSLTAEQEHLDDMRRAYAMTLALVDTSLTNSRGGGATEPDATESARAAFAASLPPAVRHLGTNMQQWSAKYLDLCAKTKGRDDAGDHSFSLEWMDVADVPAINATYLTGAQREENGRIYVKVTNGRTRIPGTATNLLIKY
jgi:hypothetical protein